MMKMLLYENVFPGDEKGTCPTVLAQSSDWTTILSYYTICVYDSSTAITKGQTQSVRREGCKNSIHVISSLELT